MRPTSLKSANAHIQTKYPQIFLVRGNGYYWVASNDDNIGLQLAGLYTTIIGTPRITMLTPEQWLEQVEYILADSVRLPTERTPVKF